MGESVYKHRDANERTIKYHKKLRALEVEDVEQGRVSEFVALASSAAAYPLRDTRVVAGVSALACLKRVQVRTKEQK